MSRLKDYVQMSTRLENPDFYICIKGSGKDLGRVCKTTPHPTTSWAGVKVKEECLNVLIPDYLFYVLMHLHNIGQFKKLGHGTLELQYLRLKDLGQIPCVFK